MREQMKRVEAAYARLGKEYRKRKKKAEAAVVEWRWAKASLFDIRPLYAESRGRPVGKPLKKRPANPKNHFECGYAADGRVMAERQYNELGMYETFYDWSADPVEVAHYDYDREKEPINLLHAYTNGGRVVSTHVSAVYGFTSERYVWKGGRVYEIDVRHADRADGRLKAVKKSHTVRATYAGEVLKRVVQVTPRT